MSSKTLGIWQDTRMVASSPTYIDDVYFKPVSTAPTSR